MHTFWRRLRLFFRREKLERELEEEMRAHLEMSGDENRENGILPDEARYAARRQFGNPTVLRETSREMWGWRVVEEFARDVCFALRVLRKNPGFTTVAVLTLALGIGANTAIISLADAALLRMLPVAKPEQLDRLAVEYYDSTFPFLYNRDSRELRQRMRSFSGIIARSREISSSMAAGAQAAPAAIELVSGNYFTALGVKPLAGRLLTDDDDRTLLAHPVAVLSYRCWQQRLGADPAAVGKTIRIAGYPYSIVGIAPPSFWGVEVGSAPDAWVPIMMVDQFYRGLGRSYLERLGLNVLARRAPGVSREQAQAELNVVYRQIQESDPE